MLYTRFRVSGVETLEFGLFTFLHTSVHDFRGELRRLLRLCNQWSIVVIQKMTTWKWSCNNRRLFLTKMNYTNMQACNIKDIKMELYSHYVQV